MKRKFLALIAMAFLLAQMLLPESATGMDTAGPQIKAAYWQDDNLYTFVKFASAEMVDQKVFLIVNNQQVSEANAARLADAGAVVHYMLLVDTSNSMGWCRNQILTFAKMLLESNENVKISLAKFDRSFSVVGTDLTAWEEVKSALEALTFYKDGSDINGSAAAAIEYLGTAGYELGELTNLIVITDGEPWYSNDGNLEKQLENEANQKIAALMDAYPEIFVHTLSFMKWQEAAYAPYPGNNGLHFEKCKVEEAADTLIGFVNSLHAVFLPLRGYREEVQIPDDMMLRFGMNFISYGHVRNAGMVPELEIDVSQEHIPEETLSPDEPNVTEPAATEAAEETNPVETEPEVAATAESEAETISAAAEETTAKQDVPVKEGNEELPKSSAMMWVAISAVVVIVAVIAMIVTAKKRKTRNHSVRMKINRLAGPNVRLKEAYYLLDEIRIGTEKKSDITIADSNGRVNVRIFKQDQLIYVEDLGTTDGILLNGMRLFAPNRLRSGDEIAVGSTVLQVLF